MGINREKGWGKIQGCHDEGDRKRVHSHRKWTHARVATQFLFLHRECLSDPLLDRPTWKDPPSGRASICPSWLPLPPPPSPPLLTWWPPSSSSSTSRRESLRIDGETCPTNFDLIAGSFSFHTTLAREEMKWILDDFNTDLCTA